MAKVFFSSWADTIWSRSSKFEAGNEEYILFEKQQQRKCHSNASTVNMKHLNYYQASVVIKEHPQ